MPAGYNDPSYRERDCLAKDDKVYENRGTPYPVTQREIDVIQDRMRESDFYTRRPMSVRRTVQQLQDAHAPAVHLDRSQRAAMERLQRLGDLPRFGPDIAIKVFNDLDKIFFLGTLRNNVYVRWTNKRGEVDDTFFGVTYLSGDPSQRIMIQLNSTALMKPNIGLRDVWSTLIHEMIHAYLMLTLCRIDPHDHDPNSPGDRCHGPIFQACMRSLQYRLGGSNFIQLDTVGDVCPYPKPGGFKKDVYHDFNSFQGQRSS